jgi:hypothetical protein
MGLKLIGETTQINLSSHLPNATATKTTSTAKSEKSGYANISSQLATIQKLPLPVKVLASPTTTAILGATLAASGAVLAAGAAAGSSTALAMAGKAAGIVGTTTGTAGAAFAIAPKTTTALIETPGLREVGATALLTKGNIPLTTVAGIESGTNILTKSIIDNQDTIKKVLVTTGVAAAAAGTAYVAKKTYDKVKSGSVNASTPKIVTPSMPVVSVATSNPITPNNQISAINPIPVTKKAKKKKKTTTKKKKKATTKKKKTKKKTYKPKKTTKKKISKKRKKRR